MKIRILALIAAIGMICSAIPIGAEYLKNDVLGGTFPEQIGKLTFQGRKDYQEPGLGYSMLYQDEHPFKVDVYVYDNNLPDIGEGTNSRRVIDEFASLIKVFSALAEPKPVAGTHC